ncbi:alpha/beta hydrolase [Cryptosporangium phraense]|uniref:DUF1023 domain-containing protein n=1 Tax=Cryptosporangium phraense TaxID=2593070 RepID=A0A545ASG1_9ACTN|nr:alpha/beta hydrolase [Cryptosporangium phraense]TQS43605.1 hypothetical protein FL583_18390 [Cryptosporangium phraense]
MVELDALRDARLSDVESTGGAWRRLAGRFAASGEDAVSDLVGPVHASNWDGDAAGAAFRHIDGLDDGFGLLAEQARAVGVLVDAVATRFRGLQRQLSDIEREAHAAGARVRVDGSVEPPYLTASESVDDLTAARRNNETARVFADRIADVLAEATRLDEQYAAALTRYLHPPSGVMSPSEVLDAAQDAKDNAPLLGADKSRIPTGKSAWTVDEWWKGLTADQQQAYLTAYPDEIGALNGIPAVARDQANRKRLTHYLAAMEINAERLYGRPGGRVFDESYEPARKLYAKLESSEYGPESHRLYLLGFNPDFGQVHQGRAIVAVGDPDTAKNVATMVPGLNTELEDASTLSLHRAENLVDAADARTFGPDGDTSVIAWLDYDAPEGYPDDPNLSVATTGRAEQGAARLDAFVNGLHATHQGQGHYTAIGHSYGSTTVGYAAAQNDGLAVDDVIVAGSPGTTVGSASDLHIDRHHVWAGQAADDPIKYASGLTLGKDPTDLDFGANQFHVDTHGHGDYWEADTRSVTAQAAIVVGDYDYFRDDPGTLDHTSDQGVDARHHTDRYHQRGPYGAPR